MKSLFTYFKNYFSPSISDSSLTHLTGIERADAIFQSIVSAQKLPGVSVSILQKGAVILEKGYGYSDLENEVLVAPKKTIFRTASVSKCITGLALGKMVDQKILNFEDSFYKHVPYYPKKKYDFTLRQLASHTAGIRGYRGKEFGLNEPYSIKDSLEVFQDDPLVFQPGKGYLYNSFDFVLLSLAMQEASGVPFEKYVEDEILEPLGMVKTYAPTKDPILDSLPIENQAKFYTKRATGFKTAIPVNNFYKLAGGGYLATSADIAKLGQAVLEKQLLQKETYNHILTSKLVNDKPVYYGLGFQVSQDDKGRAFIGHVGSNVGGYSNLFIYPNEELVISILVNCTDPKVQEKINEAINAIFEAVLV